MDDAAIFAEISRDLRRFAAVVRPADVDPEDLVQEALARTLRHGPLARLDDPGAYLARTVANLASDHRRSWGRRRRRQDLLGRPTPTTDAYPSDLDELLAVPPGERAVLWLVVVEGRSHGEVADHLHITPGASRTRLTRALARLRVAIEQEDNDADDR